MTDVTAAVVSKITHISMCQMWEAVNRLIFQGVFPHEGGKLLRSAQGFFSNIICISIERLSISEPETSGCLIVEKNIAKREKKLVFSGAISMIHPLHHSQQSVSLQFVSVQDVEGNFTTHLSRARQLLFFVLRALIFFYDIYTSSHSRSKKKIFYDSCKRLYSWTSVPKEMNFVCKTPPSRARACKTTTGRFFVFRWWKLRH